MIPARQVGEHRWDEDHLGSFQCKNPVDLTKPQVVADTQTYRAHRCGADHNLVPRFTDRRFLDGWSTHYVDIKEMDLTIPADDFSVRTEDNGGVKKLVSPIDPFEEAPTVKPDMVLPCPFCHLGRCGARNGLGLL